MFAQSQAAHAHKPDPISPPLERTQHHTRNPRKEPVAINPVHRASAAPYLPARTLSLSPARNLKLHGGNSTVLRCSASLYLRDVRARGRRWSRRGPLGWLDGGRLRKRDGDAAVGGMEICLGLGGRCSGRIREVRVEAGGLQVCGCVVTTRREGLIFDSSCCGDYITRRVYGGSSYLMTSHRDSRSEVRLLLWYLVSQEVICPSILGLISIDLI